MAWAYRCFEPCYECGETVEMFGEPEPEEVVCDFCQLPEEKREKIYENIQKLLDEEG